MTIIKNNILTLTLLVIAALASYANYNIQDTKTTENTLEAGQFITSEFAAAQHITTETLFGEATILEILNEKNTQGLRIYEGQEGLILIGTDAEGNDILDGRVAAFGLKNIGHVAMMIRAEVRSNLAVR